MNKKNMNIKIINLSLIPILLVMFMSIFGISYFYDKNIKFKNEIKYLNNYKNLSYNEDFSNLKTNKYINFYFENLKIKKILKENIKNLKNNKSLIILFNSQEFSIKELKNIENKININKLKYFKTKNINIFNDILSLYDEKSNYLENFIIEKKEIDLIELESKMNKITSILIILFIIIFINIIFIYKLIKFHRFIEDITININKIYKKSLELSGEKSDIKINENKTFIELLNSVYEIINNFYEKSIKSQKDSESKSYFLASMSHEIRTPLNGVLGFTDLLKDTKLNDEQMEFVDIIDQSSKSLLTLINSILDLSKVENNSIEFENISFNPIEKFEHAIEIYGVKASEKNINLGLYIDPKLDIKLNGDPEKVSEVLVNLMSNAVKFTDEGGNINVEVIKLKSDSEMLTKILFSVEDDGIGVSKDKHDKIFEAFGQADKSTTREYGGTGLGLSISFKYIEMMGGKLELKSKVGNGSKFYFTLEFTNNKNIKEPKIINDVTVALLFNDRYKKQNEYIKKYLDNLSVNYEEVFSFNDYKTKNFSFDFTNIFIDFENSSKDDLRKFNELNGIQKTLIYKTSNKKNVDVLKLINFKKIYEPINFNKIYKTLTTNKEFILPSYLNKKDTNKKEKHQIKMESKKVTQPYALVVEDSPINRKLIISILGNMGIIADVAIDGLLAIEKRKEKEYDIIFMDINMPNMSGDDATQEIIKWEKENNKKHIPIVAVTANALPGDKDKYLSKGLDDYIPKPISIKIIQHMFNKWTEYNTI